MMRINVQKRDLLIEFIKTNFKLRYRNSVLGFIWVLLKPFLTFLVLYVVFVNFNRGVKVENYALYLLIGVMLFNFFSESLTFGMSSLLEKSHIILKVNFDRSLAILSSMALAGVNFLINLLVMVVFFAFSPANIDFANVLYFMFVMIVMFIFMTGLANYTSIMLLQFRDLENLVPILLQLIFYATPIFYSIDILPATVKSIVALNPLYILIYTARQSIVYGKITNVPEILLVGIVGVVIFITGRIYFNKKVKRIAELF